MPDGSQPATGLARKNEEDAPHLIYAPEFHFDSEKFLKEVDACIKKYGWVSIVCGEGLKYSDGNTVSSATVKDKFNNTEFVHGRIQCSAQPSQNYNK